ncbi:hypothetical protein SASPL_106877 [Salvia splendens]|uniref:Uncharacterized protein n=1 Tax=Salvia splendens TaxID=180675 RepID=A0A8X8YFS2_SALSN|nr:hypothetical protein SASPL_106877 [Salvia splendens]
MLLKFGSFPVVVGSSVDAAKIFLKTMDLTFASRPKTSAGKYLTYNYSDITWSEYGPHWRQARKMCLMELFSTRRIDSYEYIRAEETVSLVKEIFGLSGRAFWVKDSLSTLSLNVISRMVLGRRYMDGGAAVPPEEFKKMLDELFFLGGVFNIGDMIPYINFLDLQGYVKRMKVLSGKFDRFLERVLNEHEARRRDATGHASQDMVDVLLEFAEDPTLEVKLERHMVKAFTQDMLAGGTESSAVTVEWAMSELLKKREIFKKATEELDRVIGQNRWVTENDIPSLPYVEAIVKEIMRLHPVAPMLVPRLAREDYVKGQDFELLPFGSGRRMCPGYALGLKVNQSSLANLLHGFNWSLPGDMKPEELNMEETFGLSMPKKFPLVTIAQPRLPLHLYNFM